MKKFLLLVFLAFVVMFLCAKYVEPYSLSVKEYTIKNENISMGYDGVKIVHFSDTLLRNKKDLELFDKVITEINTINPELIFFTGNLLHKTYDKDIINSVANSLSNLKSEFKYFVPGTTDNDDSIKILNDSLFINLDETSKYYFEKDVLPVVILGYDGVNELIFPEENYEYNTAFILTHKPDNYDNLNLTDKNYFVFAGHSLGGEIRIPFYGSLIRNSGAKKYTNDFYERENSYLYVNYGIGLGKTYLRLFNKPSINIYTLYSK